MSQTTTAVGADAGQDWLERGRARCRRALRDATAAADRMALLRELARLSDGYVDLGQENIELTSAELSIASHFGLATGGGLLRLTDVPGLSKEVADCFKLDSSLRRRSVPGTPDAALLRWTTYDVYRSETQKAAVRAMETMPDGASLMVSMPTGTGKSLLFQLAPFVWAMPEAQTCAVVITPTIALALDHERTLRAIEGLENSRALTSQLTREEREEVLFAFRRGEIPLLLLSPEQAFGSAKEALLEAATPPDAKHGLNARLGAFFIDEAHIVESWGRSFRPDFQRLPALVADLRERNPALRTILLSATIGRTAQVELRRAYGSSDWLEIHAGVPRYEFDLATLNFTSKDERNRALDAVINSAPRPAIIYTTLVEHAGEVYRRLTTDKGFERVALFTGEISDGQTRQSIVDRWADDQLDLVVATSAFGMGIDKADVRTVIHACLPESPARYYQEIGRAARDGHQGHGVGLWFASSDEDDDDERLARRMAGGSWITRDKAEKRWRAILAWGSANGGLKWHGSRRRMTVNLDAVREGLNSETSDYNRLWNMSVLNFLQRAGALQIASVRDQAAIPTWAIDIIDDALTSSGDAYNELWDKVEAMRDAEQNIALGDLRALKRLLSAKANVCVLSGVFELVDNHGRLAPDCGRCWVCRSRGARPPSLVESGGLTAIWSQQAIPSGRLTSPVTMVIPDDADLGGDVSQIIEAQVAAGVEQFVVPDWLTGTAAGVLATSRGRIGFVLSHSDWLTRGWALAKFPTAIFLDRHSSVSEIWRKVVQVVDDDENSRLILVGASDLRVAGRPLQQIASNQAPFSQEAFFSHVTESATA